MADTPKAVQIWSPICKLSHMECFLLGVGGCSILGGRNHLWYPRAPNSPKYVLFMYFRPHGGCCLHTWSPRFMLPCSKLARRPRRSWCVEAINPTFQLTRNSTVAGVQVLQCTFGASQTTYTCKSYTLVLRPVQDKGDSRNHNL